MELKIENKGKFDQKNKLNDLTGKEWLKLTASFWFSEKCADDKDAYKHPAPFLIKDIQKLISMFTKKKMRVLDPFCTMDAREKLRRLEVQTDMRGKART